MGAEWQRVLAPLVATPVLVAAAGELTRIALDVPVGRLLPPGELLLQLVVGWTLAALVGSLPRAVLAHAVVVATVSLVQYLKVAHLATPLRLPDLSALPELARVLGPWRVALLALPIALLIVLVAPVRRLHPGPAAAATALAAALSLGSALAPGRLASVVDGGLQDSPWDLTGTMLTRGPTGSLLREHLRGRIEPLAAPSREDVRAALAAAPARPAAPPSATRPRSLVLIVLESFWDPALLAAAGLDGDPLAPRFRALWQRGGASTALSGEFGGGTANPELEVLCGLPTALALPGVAFATSLRNPVPCLPELLGRQGWRPAAFHPNVRSFWNRAEAYPRIGFPVFVSLRGFTLDDRNGPFLSDASLYRQAWDRQWTGPGQPPPFAYLLTYTGHWDYPLNPDLRPYLYATSSCVPEVARYASSIHYSAEELAEFVDRVLADDPDALVVAVGDHLPKLGTHVEAYAESGLFGSWVQSMSAAELRTLCSVPLLVVDGPRGPLPVGTIAQFELPALILERLGLEVPRWMAAALPPPGWHVRTRADGLLVLDPDGGEHVCRSGLLEPACSVAFGWLDRARTIARDLAFGDQHALDPATMSP